MLRGQYDPTDVSRERYRRILLSALAAGGSRFAGLVSLVVVVPIASHSLGPQRFGIWITVVSAVGLFGFVDLGLGNGLINSVSDAAGAGDAVRGRESVSTAVIALLSVSLSLALIFAALYPVIPWASLLGASPTTPTGREVGPAVAMVVGLFLVGMPAGVAEKVHLGLQEGYVANAWSVAGSLLGVTTTVIVSYHHPSTATLALPVVGCPVVASIGDCVVLFSRQHPTLRPRLRSVSRGAAGVLARLGSLFFILSVAGAVGYESDNVVISHFLGPSAVASYALPFRFFLVGPMLTSLFLTPLWPAYSEALASKDFRWVDRTFRRSLMVAAAVNIPWATTLFVFTRPLMHAWVGPTASPNFGLLAAMSVYVILNTLSGPLAMLLNGATVIGFQVATALTMAVVNLGLSIVLVQHIGLSGPMFGTDLAQAVCILIPTGFYARRWLRTTRADSNGRPSQVTAQ